MLFCSHFFIWRKWQKELNYSSFYYNISIQNKLGSRKVEDDNIFNEHEAEESKNDITVWPSDLTDFFPLETTFNSYMHSIQAKNTRLSHEIRQFHVINYKVSQKLHIAKNFELYVRESSSRSTPVNKNIYFPTAKVIIRPSVKRITKTRSPLQETLLILFPQQVVLVLTFSCLFFLFSYIFYNSVGGGSWIIRPRFLTILWVFLLIIHY